MAANKTEQVFGRLALAWAALITVLSVLPSDQIFSSGFSDKWEHFAAYALLACLITFARQQTLPVWKTAAAVTLFGVLLEIIQLFIPGRHAQWQDAVADMLGAALGITLAKVLWRYIIRSEAGKP